MFNLNVIVTGINYFWVISMNLISEIESIEIPSVRNLNWYYHSFYCTEENFKDFITNGIKCRKLLSLESSGNNGNYYISLLKDLGIDEEDYGFNSFMNNSTSFIIDGINPVKCSTVMWPLYHLFSRTRLPLRGSGWKDEYQEYLKIDPLKFVGLQCPLYNWINVALDERFISDFSIDLKNLKNIILTLNEYGMNLPIYDYSRRVGENVHILDQSKYLDKCDEMVEEVKRITKSRMTVNGVKASQFIL